MRYAEGEISRLDFYSISRGVSSIGAEALGFFPKDARQGVNQVQVHSSISSLYDSLLAPDQLQKKLQIMGLQEGQKSWLASALARHYQFSQAGDDA